jgi:succinyl-CoA synthetase beta subunit
MDLVEFDAKALLRDAGLPVPPGTVLGADDTVRIERPVVVKAQVPFGGRGKKGLVLPAGLTDAQAVIATVRERMRAAGFATPVLLLEDQIETAGECYLAWRIDDVTQSHTLSFSRSGGVDIESSAEPPAEMRFAPTRTPSAHDFLAFFELAGFSGRTLTALCRFAVASWRVYVQADAQLLEINPLAITPRGEVIALDAKVSVDDNARGRHLEWSRLHSAHLASAGMTELERRAAADGFTFVELTGETALLSGGAGLGMALVDLLADEGMPAANFVDASGGSGASMFDRLGRLVFERASRDDVKQILMYFTLSATSLVGVVRGLVALFDEVPPPKPMVVGLLTSGAAEREMSFEQARQIFESRGYRCARDLQEMIDALRALRAAGPAAGTHTGSAE